MATCGIQVGNPTILNKIESFLNDSSYREAIENSANYNTRLCIERRLRMPFLDSQTGVAQNHSNLFMSPRQRIPGLIEGQIYTYPSKRWRKKRRQYLMNFMQPRRKELDPESDLHTISTVENPAASNEDSKDSVGLKDEAAKDAWYYDELDMQEMEGFDDPDPDSDYDYEESYSKRKGKKRTSKVARNTDSPATKKPKCDGGHKMCLQGPGRGRKKTNYDALTDAEKPFSCELCGARYKTRPGLTYHYTHSHKDRDDEDCSSSGMGGPEGGSMGSVDRGASPSVKQQQQQQLLQQAQVVASQAQATTDPGAAAGSSTRRGRQGSSASQHATASVPVPPVVVAQSSEDTTPTSVTTPGLEKKPEVLLPMPGSEEKERAAPSPYCDFCLGDSQENKKTGQSEELVSCSDCGRSGHPSCLQFTPNMIISVRKYRWQCIECKCCSICGTSDNDDQLLFCDDCDRGYHMYCLSPPLSSPPEGSWSCRLCLVEFHKNFQRIRGSCHLCSCRRRYQSWYMNGIPFLLLVSDGYLEV
ncbi:zinc finger protein ubi-d4 B-like isoform X3 [Zootermopsis nevadensis]|uniref:zinc finger protein ubi-d4 B-like isoform X3 n=1 Tax=Zootermopsis nevadensis TaxID=136037 RepID=UPI000B8E4EC6|nr:zinc finger protein ubi-d4 B-like isoform X3 [Zootermopsis nevadensis]